MWNYHLPGWSTSRIQQHREPERRWGQHQGELTIHHWECTVSVTWHQEEGNLANFPKHSHSCYLIFYLILKTTLWSSLGAYWPHFTIKRVWGVKGFLQVLEPVSLKAAWRLSFQTQKGGSRSGTAPELTRRADEGGWRLDWAHTSLLVCHTWPKLVRMHSHHSYWTWKQHMNLRKCNHVGK